MLDTERCYRILELEPGASPEEVHQGYLDLTWVWHPDRFVGHPRLQQKANYKLQQLNEAHAQLRSFQPTAMSTNLSTQSRVQVSRTSQQKSSESRWHPGKANHSKATRPGAGSDKRTIRDVRRCASSKVSDFNDWLD
ncbi:DnaJ domain-containing protein [Lyngbya aestuarii]|uniref:DnaJ domain-containing protein n=1 Tax=Lyngbya aestuarii TaxID=118322 RepID=UPI00403DF6BC